jgi:hypothetical protein
MSRIPLVVGITGHRDPAAVSVAAVEEAVRAILRSIRRSPPKTPLFVLSALAEGADRLADGSRAR